MQYVEGLRPLDISTVTGAMLRCVDLTLASQIRKTNIMVGFFNKGALMEQPPLYCHTLGLHCLQSSLAAAVIPSFSGRRNRCIVHSSLVSEWSAMPPSSCVVNKTRKFAVFDIPGGEPRLIPQDEQREVDSQL